MITCGHVKLAITTTNVSSCFLIIGHLIHLALAKAFSSLEIHRYLHFNITDINIQDIKDLDLYL